MVVCLAGIIGVCVIFLSKVILFFLSSFSVHSWVCEGYLEFFIVQIKGTVAVHAVTVNIFGD